MRNKSAYNCPNCFAKADNWVQFLTECKCTIEDMTKRRVNNVN